MSYVYTVNSIGLNIVYFASKQAAYNYVVKHDIKMSDGKIKIIRCRQDIAVAVRNDFNEVKKSNSVLE